MPYEYRGDIAHADIAFDAQGANLEELFQEAAKATMEVMVEDLSGIEEKESVHVQLHQTNEEMLLFDFLNELVFYKDTRRLLLLAKEVTITRSGVGCDLEATLTGEEIAPERHRLATDVKAVTMHRFAVTKVSDGWRATVVLDV